MTRSWELTDNPNDPCWLCCSVEYGDESDPMNEDTWVVWAPNDAGELVECHRVFSDLHARCAAALEDVG